MSKSCNKVVTLVFMLNSISIAKDVPHIPVKVDKNIRHQLGKGNGVGRAINMIENVVCQKFKTNVFIDPQISGVPSLYAVIKNACEILEMPETTSFEECGQIIAFSNISLH